MNYNALCDIARGYRSVIGLARHHSGYCFWPTIKWIACVLSLLTVVASITEAWAARPIVLSASVSASAAGFNCVSDSRRTSISILYDIAVPMSGEPLPTAPKLYKMPPAEYFQFICFQCALAKASIREDRRCICSLSWVFVAASNSTPANCVNSTANSAFCASEIVLGANRCSKAIILDCWALLMPSSNANKQRVQMASMTTPPITSRFATRWVDGEYLFDSNIMPAPTAKLASTLADNKIAWGQNGSMPPERNALKYVTIAAILGWLFAGLAALWALGKSVYALWRERHPRMGRD
jgi:hypothetical protein